MATTTTSGVFSNASTSTMNAWINAVCTAIFTTLGVTQTADTGQVWSSGGGATGTLPGATNTSAGYVIGRFNDTLQATCPVFFRLDFGTGATVNQPCFWITVGTSSNGSGTIGGTTLTKVACTTQTATAGTFSSYYCYNTTYGVLWIGLASLYVSGDKNMGGFALCRGSTSTGVSNSDAVFLLAPDLANAGGATGTNDSIQTISYLTSTRYPTTTLSNAGFFAINPFNGEGFSESANPMLVPVFYQAPNLSFSGVVGIVRITDIAIGSTFTATILGSTSLTFLNIGSLSGYNGSSGSGLSTFGVNYGYGLLWQ